MFTKLLNYLWTDQSNRPINEAISETINEPSSNHVLLGLNNTSPDTIIYELTLKWYTNFIGYDTRIIVNAYPILNYNEDEDEDDILKLYMPLYNKLTIEYRLIDFMFRSKQGMFSDDFHNPSSVTCCLDSLVIRKGLLYNDKSIKYMDNICEVSYNSSIIVYSNNEWEII